MSRATSTALRRAIVVSLLLLTATACTNTASLPPEQRVTGSIDAGG
jgi:hypothetical protein